MTPFDVRIFFKWVETQPPTRSSLSPKHPLNEGPSGKTLQTCRWLVRWALGIFPPDALEFFGAFGCIFLWVFPKIEVPQNGWWKYCEGLWRRGAFWARFEALFLEPAAHVTQTHQRLTTGLNVQSHVGSSGECCCCRCTASGGPLECLEGRAGGSETAIAASDSRGEESGL